MLEIKEAAKKVGMNENTIRYYTDQGLVPSVKRDANHHRLFDQASLNWLIGDHRMRAAGMSIRELRYYVKLCLKGNSTVSERAQIIDQLRIKVDQQLKAAQQRAHFLSVKSQIYHDLLNHHRTKDVLNPGTWKNN
ncbi:hypothetical protein WR164_01050 [Philodulcilactobacillus myokoensis]|uniref:HTH merR-type domain-containing protein n=1 Tax=Philodulcilactobacillus myokoensis TaxID=2929573 RepID=A0A9W6B022_9LACO|nr:MerR family transcriptional regulator [Philodulcilactobacillus myokoensis]GLB46126.1 hypothetical protein WR164_01050 [Philodulcilactobacillus myokoensis]